MLNRGHRDQDIKGRSGPDKAMDLLTSGAEISEIRVTLTSCN